MIKGRKRGAGIYLFDMTDVLFVIIPGVRKYHDGRSILIHMRCNAWSAYTIIVFVEVTANGKQALRGLDLECGGGQPNIASLRMPVVSGRANKRMGGRTKDGRTDGRGMLILEELLE